MVEHAGPLLRQVVAVDDMQDRRVAGIEPPARKLKRRPPTDLEPEQIAIEPAGRLKIVAQHREMVHCRYGHRDISCWSRKNAYSQEGFGVNGRISSRSDGGAPERSGSRAGSRSCEMPATARRRNRIRYGRSATSESPRAGSRHWCG